MQSFYNYESTRGIAEEWHTWLPGRQYKINLLSHTEISAKLEQSNAAVVVVSFCFLHGNIFDTRTILVESGSVVVRM